MNNKTYEEGYVDGVMGYLGMCERHPDCVDCPILFATSGMDDMTCYSFISKFPTKAVSLIQQDLKSGDHSYFSEYRLRMPKCRLSLQEVAESVCRKTVFEGDTSCTGGDCESCWLMRYTSNVEE